MNISFRGLGRLNVHETFFVLQAAAPPFQALPKFEVLQVQAVGPMCLILHSCFVLNKGLARMQDSAMLLWIRSVVGGSFIQ
ncbi:MAG: hypothetical protein CVV06_15090 [Gammaproteobacteria bacterium HGW-Gammaproteobacteria-10]|nr:MAG: hypothetical protein CVV06_15090 [Gammaproteobacteria bacterium HGW-Gammaproteobacteria-10]